MSDQHFNYPLDHRVFSGGRYLRAFDHLPDIDHYEHSILTYLGSLMPFDKGFIDLPAFPSVATIARSTKISASTVRKKVKELEKKGYLKVKAVRLLNPQGHFQQSSNDYLLSAIAFAFFEEVLGTQYHMHGIRKRAVGESFPYAPSKASSSQLPVGSYSFDSHPIVEAVPNSSPKIPTEHPNRPDSSSAGRDIFTMKGEVDRIARAWEDVVKRPVSKDEKDRFFRDFVRIRGHEVFFMERILLLISDPYLMSRAKSLNFLFSGFDAAQKNRRDIKQIASKALEQVETKDQLVQVLDQLPELIAKKSHNYANATQQLMDLLLHDPIAAASKRLNIQSPSPRPKNAIELRAELEKHLQTADSEEQRERLRTMLHLVSRSPFEQCLRMYDRYVSKIIT